MAGVLRPQRGHVEIDGMRRRDSVPDELAIRRCVVYLPDHPWLPKNRTGREFLLAVGRLYGIEENRLIDHVQRLLEVFDLGRESDWPIRSYSNGQQKKVARFFAALRMTGDAMTDAAAGCQSSGTGHRRRFR